MRNLARATMALAAILLALPLALAQQGAGDLAPSRATGHPGDPGIPGVPGAPVVGSGMYAPNLAVITIEGLITGVTSASVERRMTHALDAGADGIVFDLDTPGGEVGAVLEITGRIKQSPVPTMAWVNPNAYSGGAIIAIACDEIVIATGATMGDAAPVQFKVTGGYVPMPATERQKMLAPLLSEIVDSARRNGYDEILIQGLITLGVETWQVQNTRTGEIYFITEREYQLLFDAPPIRGESIIASGGQIATPPPSVPAPDVEASGDEAPRKKTPEPPAGVSEKYGSGEFQPAFEGYPLDLAEQVGTLGLPTVSTRPDFSAEDPAAYRVVSYATDGQTLLTMNEAELLAFGFVRMNQTINTDEELKRHVGAQHLRRLDPTWSESVVAFMTQGFTGLIIRGLLIVVFFIAMFVEMSAPGLGIGGVVALIALSGLIVPPLMMGASTWWALVAIVLGFGLILLEVLVIPGFGVPGLAGLAALMVGLVGTFAGRGELFPGSGAPGQSNLAWAVVTVLLASFAAIVGMYFVSKYTRSIPIVRGLILTDEQQATLSTPDVVTPTIFQAIGGDISGPVAVGAIGRSTTSLHPAGSAEFDGRLVDVVSEFGYIEPDTPVRVVNVTEYRVGVEPVGEGPKETTA